jgi:hypothetical protein
MSYFLNESFLVRGDEYYIAVCNKTGALSIYNESKNLFLSPMADGPINFINNPDGTINIKNVSKFGRSFSILRVPYSLKLLIQELQVMNVQMRIITDENVDQLLSMSYSDNISQLLKIKEPLNVSISTFQKEVDAIIKKPKNQVLPIINEKPELPDTLAKPEENESPEYAPYSPAYVPNSDEINFNETSSDNYVPEDSNKQMYEPVSPPPQSQYYQPISPTSPPPQSQYYEPVSPTSPPPTNMYYATANPVNSPKTELYYATASNPPSFSQEIFIPKTNVPSNILDVEENTPSNLENSDESTEKNSNKKVVIVESNDKEDTSTNSQTKEIKNITL